MNASSDILPLNCWLEVPVPPLVISGPCSAETEEQVLATAREVAKIPQVKIFRAGIWKPRTRPNSFEGVGTKGLEWLRTVRQETGLLTTVEVANPHHVEEALRYGVDILWLGARTVVNPFSIQEISDVLQGIDIPVLIKNPVNPDLKLWIGAIERINHSGIRKLAAIHRGFYFFERSPYRNAPMWEIPIQLKRHMPELPIICDPSHICGNKESLFEVAQKSLDLAMNGLMIETHIRPSEALTDAEQQITPDELRRLIKGLTLRTLTGTPDFQNKLEELRSEIDKMDAELLNILSRRMEIVRDIGEYKRLNNITILQLKRWSKVVADRTSKGKRLGLSTEFLLDLLEIIHKESIQIQTEVFRNGKKDS